MKERTTGLTSPRVVRPRLCLLLKVVTFQVQCSAVASDEISCDACFNKSDARLLLACLIVYGKRLSEKSTEADSTWSYAQFQ